MLNANLGRGVLADLRVGIGSPKRAGQGLAPLPNSASAD
jgi:hypothetical protein